MAVLSLAPIDYSLAIPKAITNAYQYLLQNVLSVSHNQSRPLHFIYFTCTVYKCLQTLVLLITITVVEPLLLITLHTELCTLVNNIYNNFTQPQVLQFGYGSELHLLVVPIY